MVTADRIILSHETALKTYYLGYGGWSYGHVLRRVVPLLRERGVSEEQVDAILIDTPRRVLTSKSPPRPDSWTRTS